MSKESEELDRVADMAHKEHISYGELQMRETSIRLKMEEQERIRRHAIEIQRGFK